MNQRRLMLSISLGAAITIGLLFALSVNAASMMASHVDSAVLGTAQESASATIRAQGTLSPPHTAHVVVVLSGENTAVRAITWTGTITRIGALRAAGFDVVQNLTVSDLVCSIDGDGCPASDPWCLANNWWQGQWDANAEAWDSSVWPPPEVDDGDVIAFHNGTAWVEPALPAPSYQGGLRALEWLRLRQDMDTGSYGGVGATVETMLAAGANRWNAGAWRRQADSPSMLHYMYGSGASYVTGGGPAGKTAVALASSGACWPVDASTPMDYYDPATGQFAPQAVNQAWAMLGVKAMSQTIPVSATQALKDMITANGGWGWPGWGEDTDTTALAVEALVAAGESPTATHVVSGLNYVKTRQNSDGGFNPGWTSDTSGASTAAAVRAMLAVGQSPLSVTWTISGNTPISYLVGAQQADGSFLYGGSPNEVETRQVAVAMLGRPFPLGRADVPPCYGISGRVTAGRVVSGAVTTCSAGDAMPDVTVTADGWNNSGIKASTDATGAYTLSVPEAGDYSLVPLKSGYVFTPAVQIVTVGGSPGDVVMAEDIAGQYGFFMPLVFR